MREWRKSNNLTLQNFAERVQVSYSQIARIETGKSKPSPAVADRIEAVTGGEVSAARLLGLTGASSSQSEHGKAESFHRVAEADLEQLREEAVGYGLDMDAIAHKAIEDAVKAERIRRWNEDNREAVESWNELVEREGLWSDGIRAF